MDDPHSPSSLIARLRDRGEPLHHEAAEELARLRSDVLRLRRINHELANKLNEYHLRAQLQALDRP